MRFFIMLAFLLSITAACFAEPQNVTDKVYATEMALYGSEQSGALMDRLDKLDKDVLGSIEKDPFLVRSDNLVKIVADTNETSLVTKVNITEWMITQQITDGSVKTRLDKLEQLLAGKSGNGSFQKRIDDMFSQIGSPRSQTVSLAKDTLIKVRLAETIDSNKNHTGDLVKINVAEDVFVDNVLVIPKGAVGIGKIKKISPAKNFGRDAVIELNIKEVTTVLGQKTKVVIGEKAVQETKSLAKTAGATVAGLAILGPVGIIGGAFVNGQDVVLHEGSQFFVQTLDIIDITGFTVK